LKSPDLHFSSFITGLGSPQKQNKHVKKGTTGIVFQNKESGDNSGYDLLQIIAS